MAAVFMLTTFGHHFDRREEGENEDNIVVNRIKVFAEIDRLLVDKIRSSTIQLERAMFSEGRYVR